MTNRDKVYKYRKVSDRDISMLSANKLWAATPESLNDVFEPLLIYHVNKELHQYMSQKYGTDIEPDKAFKPDEHDLLAQKQLSVIRGTGVFSLSYCKHQKLLWSLYADSMRGFVIEFDKEKLLKIEHQEYFDVEYTEKPGVRPLEQTKTIPEKIIDYYSAYSLLSQKTKDWEQEEEFRIVFTENGSKKYPEDSVTAIYFGYQMDVDIRRLITRIMPEHIEFYEVYPDINTNGDFVYKDRKLDPRNILFNIKTEISVIY